MGLDLKLTNKDEEVIATFNTLCNPFGLLSWITSKVSIPTNDFNHSYDIQSTWLKQEIMKFSTDNYKLIVITHHVPIPELIHPKYHRFYSLSSS